MKKLLLAFALVILFFPYGQVLGQPCAPAPAGMLSWWKGDGNANDFLGARPATLSAGATADASGVVGQAFNFASGWYYAVASDAGLPASNTARTVELWMKPSSSCPRVFGYGQSSPDDAFFVTMSGNAAAIGRAGGGDVAGTRNVNDGNWHHCALTYDGAGTARLYVDGELDAVANWSYHTTLGGGFYLSSPSFGFVGQLDEVAIYNLELSAVEVMGLYQVGGAGKCLTNSFSIVPAGLLDGVVGTPYVQALSATNGLAPYTFALTNGALPAGLSLSSGGLLSGTPTAAGSSTFAVQVTDAASQTATRTFSLRVRAYSGTSYVWNGSAGDWSDSTRWIPNGVPGPTDEANINAGSVTVSADTNVAALNFNGGNLYGNAVLTVSVLMNWTAGEMDDGGTTRIGANAVLNISGPSAKGFRQPRVLENFGHAYWSGGYIYGYYNSSIQNRAGAVFEIQTDQQFYQAGPAFYNAGTLRKTITTGVQNFDWYLYNSGTGTVDLQTGTLNLDAYCCGPALNNSGSVTMAPGTRMIIQSGTNSGTINVGSNAVVDIAPGGSLALNTGSTVTGAGLFRMSGGSGMYLYLNGPASVANFDFLAPNGVVSGPGTLTVSNVMNWTAGMLNNGSTLSIAAGGTLNASGGTIYIGSTFNNAGHVVVTGTTSLNIYPSTFITNQAGGIFEFQSTAGVGNFGATFNNAGLLRKSTSSAGTPMNMLVNNTGTIEVQTGTLQLIGGFTPYQLYNSGAIVLGAGSLWVGGNYTSTPSASVSIALAGLTPVSQYGVLQIQGNAGLAGALNVALTNSFIPATGSSFLVVSNVTRSGIFAATNGLDLGGGLRLALSYPAQGTLLSAVALGFGPTMLPLGFVGTAYSQAFTGSNGIAPYSFAVVGGSLPPGLALAADGTLSGTPTLAGVYNFTMRMLDGAGNSAQGDVALEVLACSLVNGLVSLWHSDGDARDGVGTNHGTLQGGATFAAGKLGQAFSFNGSTAYVDAGSGLQVPGDITVSAWVKVAGTASSYQFIGASRTASGPDLGWELYLYQDGRVGFQTPGGTAVGTSNIRDNQWHHLAGVRAGTDYYVYVDGNVQNHAVASTGSTASGIATCIGKTTSAYDSASTRWNGLIDEFAVYSRALGPADIADLYNQGNGGSCVDLPIFLSLGTLPDGRVGTPYWQMLTVTLGHPPLTFGLTNGALPAGLTLSGTGLISGTPLSAGTNSFTVTLTDALGHTAQRDFTLAISPSLPCVAMDGAWARWAGESNTTETINGFNGTLVNGATYTPGVVGQAFWFDGVDDYFQASVPYLPNSTGGGVSSDKNCTVELWLRLDAAAPAGGAWVAGWGQAGARFGLGVQSDQRLALFGTSAVGPALDVGRWYYVAGVFESGYAKLYVDGQMVASTPSGFGAGSGAFYLGQFPPGSPSMPLRGAVDEPAVFTRALSAFEIQSIYAAGSSGKCPVQNQTAPSGTVEVIARTFDPTTVMVRGLAFDPQNQPVAAWFDGGLCRWAWRANGVWNTNQIGASGYFGYSFALRDDGHPFFLYSAKNVYLGNDTFGTGIYLVDGVVQPSGPGTLAYTGGGGFANALSVLAFPPGAASPSWVYDSGTFGGTIYDGVAAAGTLEPGADYCINHEGVRALIDNQSGSVQLSRTPGLLSGPVVTTGVSGANVSAVVDDNGIFHALLSGYLADQGSGVGKMLYATSTNGTNWAMMDLGPGVDSVNNHCARIALDPCGRPGIAYLRAGQLWYGELLNGHWAQTALGIYSAGASSESLRLAYDRNGKPAICLFDPGTTNLLLCRPTPFMPPPVAICQNLTVYLNAAGQATISGADVDGGSTAACGIVSRTVTPSSFTWTNLGTNTVTLTVTDGCCQNASCPATVIVRGMPVILPDGFILDPYSQSLGSFLTNTYFNFTLLDGALPAGLTLDNSGLLSGTPTVFGNFSFAVLLTDDSSRTTVQFFSLKVNLRPPRFTQAPSDAELQLGQVLWLAAQTDLPGDLQWYFNGLSIPGETNAWFIRTNFTAALAGAYVLGAANDAGVNTAAATVRLLQPKASRDGPVSQPPQLIEGNQLLLGFATQPDRTYLLQRADEITTPMQWTTVLRFTATNLNSTFIDQQMAQVRARYYRILEEPAPQPSSFSTADTSHFVPLDSSGQPISGGSLATNQNGQTGAFEMRPAGNLIADGLGLKLKLPNGASVTQTNGQTQLQFQTAQFQFGPDSPIQFNEPLVVNSLTNVSLTAGALTVSQIETLSGKAQGSGLEVTLFGWFHLRLTRGTFSGNKLLGAQFALESDAALSLPLPGLSGDYPQFAVELDPAGSIRIPFSGTFALPDETASPVTLTIPATRPCVLEVRADGHFGVTGHADAEFKDGPKFGVDFTFSDPQYRLRLSAAHISLPPLFSVADLLPAPPSVPDLTDDATLNPVAQRLDWAETAAANFAALAVNDATAGSATAPDSPPAIEPGGRAFLDLWKSVALAYGLGNAQGQIEAAASRASRTAASSDDALEVAQALADLAEMAGKGDPAIADATDNAGAALVRILTKDPCGDLTPVSFNLTLSNLLAGATLLQQLGSPRASELLDAAHQVLICYAQQYLESLQVKPDIFTNPPGSRIATMQRYEAVDHLAQLLQLRVYAQRLGVLDTLNAPMTEGHACLALRIWDELQTKMETAIAANDRRTYLYLMPEVAEFVALVQSGVLPQRSELDSLPTADELASLYGRAFTNGPVEILAQDAYGTDLTQLRDDLTRFRFLLQGIPDSVTTAPSMVQRNFDNLNQRLAAVTPYVGASTVFSTKDLAAALEAGIVNEEIRLRFHLAAGSVWIDTQLGAVAQKLSDRVEGDDDWSQAHVGARLLLEAAAHALQRATNANTSADDAAAWRIARKAYLKEASTLCASLNSIASSLWDDAETSRNANLGLRLVDMLLPGGMEVDEAAGEISYNSRTRTLSGAVSGKMLLPGSGLALDLNNASFSTGGAFDFNLGGSFDLPAQGTLVHFEVPDQHPLHLALDLDRHLTLEGGLKARLKNGMEFDAWASLNDPVYTFGAAVRGVRFSLATNLTLNVQVPDANALSHLGADLQPLMVDYFGALGGTLEPLRAVAAPPVVAPPGQPPEFSDPTVSFNSDTLAAASLALRLLASNTVSLGFSSVQDAAYAITNIAANVNRELDRSADSISQLGQDLANLPSDPDERRAVGKSSLQRLLEQMTVLTNDLVFAYSNLARNIPGAESLLTSTNLIGVLSAAGDALHVAVDDPANLTNSDAALTILRIGVVWETIRQQFPQAELPDVCPWLSPFVIASRSNTLFRASLSSNGSLPADRTEFNKITYDQFIGFTLEVLEQERLLQHLCPVDDVVRFQNAMTSFYVGRHDIIVRRIHDTETKPLEPPFDDDVVRQVKVFFQNLVPVLETEEFAQRVGLNYQASVQVMGLNGDLTSQTLDKAETDLLEHISAASGKIADFMESAPGTSNQRRILTEYVKPEVRRWSAARKNGLIQVTLPARTVYRSTTRPLPSDAHSGIERTLETAVRQRLDDLASDAAHLTLGLADATRRLSELVALAEAIDLTLDESVKASLLGRLQTDIFPPFRTKLVGVAQANKAWWLTQRTAANLLEALRDKAHSDSTVFAQVLTNEFQVTRDATAGFLAVLRDDVRSQSKLFDLKLPGDLNIADVHGQITFNTKTRFISGDFGGRLEFPDLHDSYITINRLHLDTDGHFDLGAVADISLPGSFPGFDSPRFKGTITIDGQKVGTTSFDGTIAVKGSGTLTNAAKANGDSFTATLSYSQVITTNSLGQEQVAWQLGVSVSGNVNLVLDNDFVLFSAAASGSVGSTGVGPVDFGGKAGMFRKDPHTPLTNDTSKITPDMFQLVVENVQVDIRTNHDLVDYVQVTITNGDLRLPPLFQLSTNLCTNPGAKKGPQVAIDPGHPIIVQFDLAATDPQRPPLRFQGGVQFYNLGFPLPMPGAQVEVCTATLFFTNFDLPVLTNINASLQMPLPNKTTNYLDLKDGAFGFDGLPTGFITIRSNLVLGDFNGLKLTLIGHDHPTNQFPCKDLTGLTVTNEGLAFPTFILSGGLVVSLPADVATGMAGDSVSGAVCGSVKVSFPTSDGPPELDLKLDGLAFGVNSLHIGGKDGLVITNAQLSIPNLAALLNPTEQSPFIITVGGSVILPNGPLLGLSGAQMRWFDPNRLPRFTFSELNYNGANWELMQGLPIQLTRATLKLKNPNLDFPALLAPTNVTLILSAAVNIPPDTNQAKVVISGAVDSLVIEFDANGLPKKPSIDGFEIGVGNMKLPPINDLGGRLRIGGLQGDSLDKVYVVGRLSGSYTTYKLAFLCAFTWTGPVGMCLDVNFGASGIIFSPTPFMISGASGGISFLNANSDPCAFDSYFTTDPSTGNKVLKANGTQLIHAMTWAQFRDTAARMEQMAQNYPKPALTPPDFGSGPAASSRQARMPLTPGSGGGSGGATPLVDSGSVTVSTSKGDVTLVCPGECPPATINILCQPHPDGTNYPNRVIFKFSAIDRSTLSTIGLSSNWFARFTGTAADVANQMAPEVASQLTNFVAGLTPPIAPGVPTGVSNLLAQAQASTLDLLYNTTIQTITNVLGTNSTTDGLFDKFADLAWQGIPCQDMTEAFAGRGSIVGVGAIGYVEGRFIISSAGSAGVIGTLNVLGVPLGLAKVFIAATDANGDPNPSICGQVNVSFGPLEIGDVRVVEQCDGCVTKIIGVFPALARNISEPLLRDIVGRLTPAISNLSTLSSDQIIAQVMALPDTNRFPVLAGFFAELMNQPPGALPANLPQIFGQTLAPVVSAIDPKETLCGQVQPKLFGFPLTGSSKVFVGAQADMQGYIGAFSFPPSYVCPVFPPGDLATLSWDLRARDPMFFLAGALDGRLSSPQAAMDFTREQIDYALEHTVFGLSYEFHPFGLHIADAGARLIMPDLLNHPAMPWSTWRPPEARNLPSRHDVLIQAAVSDVLGNAFGWHGDTNDFASIYPFSSIESNVLANQHLDLRKDYFPHGGLLGAGQLAMPLMLGENPTNWLTLISDMQTNANFLHRLESAQALVSDHILQTTTNGQFSFYLPAPNPPLLYASDGTPGIPDASGKVNGVNLRSLTAQQVLDSIKQFDPTKQLHLGQIYPAQYAFGSGWITGDFLGLPIGSATISVNLFPQGNNDSFGYLTANVPPDSWLQPLLGTVDLNINLMAPPAWPIETAFLAISNQIGQAITCIQNGGDPYICSSNVLAVAYGAVATNLPRAYLEVPVTNLPAALPAWVPFVRFSDGTFYAYSPRFDTNAPTDTPVSRARHDGGLAASCSLAVYPDIGAFSPSPIIQVERAELAVTPQGNGAPRFSGLLSNITFVSPPPFLSALNLHPQADGTFDSAGNPIVSMHASIDPIQIPSASSPVFSLQPLTPGATTIAGDFTLSAGNSQSTAVATLALDPVILSIPFEPSLLVHGSGAPTNRLVLSAGGLFVAGVSFQYTSGPDSSSFDLRAKNPVSGEYVVVARISGMPQESFQITGTSVTDFTLNFAIDSGHAPLTVALFPDDGALRANLPSTLTTFTIDPASQSFSFRLSSDGSFELHAALASAIGATGPFPGFNSGAAVTINNNGISINGNAGTATVTFTADLDGHVNWSGDLSFAPWTWFGGCVKLSAANGGSFTASADSGGFQVSQGLKLTIVCDTLLGPGNSPFSLTPGPRINSDGSFSVELDNPSLQTLSVAGYSLKSFSSLHLSGIAPNYSGSYLRLDFVGDLDLSPALHTGVAGFVDTRNGVQLQLSPSSQDLNLMGLGFNGVRASFSSGAGQSSQWPNLSLSVTGQLSSAWGFLPAQLRTFSGSLGKNGALNLNSQAANLSSALAFALKNATNRFSYSPGSYAGVVHGGNPLGYWRLEDNNNTALDSPAWHGYGQLNHPNYNGIFTNNPSLLQPGAFETNNNRAVLFDGSSQYVNITDEPPFHSLQKVTIETWFKTSGSASSGGLVGKGASWMLQLVSGQLSFYTDGLVAPDGSDASDLRGSGTFNDRAWHHVVAVYDGSAKFLYVDGKLNNWQAARGSLAQNNNHVLLAALSDTSVYSYFHGTLDEVAVYDHALPPADALDHYLAGGHGGIHLDAVLDQVASVPTSLQNLGVHGVLGADQTAALQIDSAGKTLGFSGIQAQNFSASVVKTPSAAMISVGGDLWITSLAGSHKLASASGFLSSLDSFNLALNSAANSPIDGFNFYILSLDATGNWKTGTGRATLDGRFDLPHNLGSFSFTGSVPDMTRRSFTLNSDAGLSLTLGTHTFTVKDTMKLTETQLSAGGTFSLGGTGSASLGASLSVVSGGDLAGTLDGSTGWTSEFPGVWSLLAWHGGFSFVTANGSTYFSTTFSGTFYGSLPDSRSLDGFPDGVNLGWCCCGSFGESYPCGTDKESAGLTINPKDGSTQFKTGVSLNGHNLFDFTLH